MLRGLSRTCWAIKRASRILPCIQRAFIPGAIADSMTSYGGIIFGPNGQTTLLEFIQAGASGSYGTVTEPSAALDKFPDPRVYFYQARGFSIAESYYQSLVDPHEGLIVAEPLSAPYAARASGSWTTSTTNLRGASILGCRFNSADSRLPLQQIDLFVDGKLQSTLTNISPQAGNLLSVSLNGFPVDYEVPPGANLARIAAELAGKINSPEIAAATGIKASSFGDRIQLESSATNETDISYFFSPPEGLHGNFYRVRYLPGSAPAQVAPLGHDAAGSFQLRLEGPNDVESVVEASTNLIHWTPFLTNFMGGTVTLLDPEARFHLRRFYRVASQPADIRPRLSMLPPNGPLRILTTTHLPYTVEASADLVTWDSIYTNFAGASMDFQDHQARYSPSRFYRALLQPALPSPPPQWTVDSSAPDNTVIMRIDRPTRAFAVEVSSDLVHWNTVHVNREVGKAVATVSSAKGKALFAGTFIEASRDRFLDSLASGETACVINGTVQQGTCLTLNITKTDGSRLSLTATNEAFPGTVFGLCEQLTNLINSSPSLQGPDGLMAEDLVEGVFGAACFNLVARSPGQRAANLVIEFVLPASLVSQPEGASRIGRNMEDLRPRNHLHVTCGAHDLRSVFSFDTSKLPDGFHELAAVAYEGSHVRTQSRITLPVKVKNRDLTAQITLPGVPATTSIPDLLRVRVTASTNAIRTLQLYSTGGLLGTVTNRSTAEFTVPSRDLGAGLHPIYAIVEAADGARYRTEVLSHRFVNP